ncbi:twin-arginine translocase TatA/TatE family subunit [Wenzhouxiangella sp. AB-CW3]|uniref:twin-arginine translocase TatA/TatE family subunit n=1 Tax=Wenzhouxiangella sp. AB-CW3 TaxID=2771012 RepID=UPI00168B9A34|nr:twin-arginine translocase TatA/TatE family subunit [Wenzhouxiangella sp. AB-CW3]QOC22317.1 twin-arginine translocase TatA/TatE family subunit [Wenzhouxiangella sp. AB-CW3]
MGIGNIGWFQILVILLIVLLIFGTKRIRNLGSDLGGAIREFRKGVSEDDSSNGEDDESDESPEPESSTRSERSDSNGT